MLRLCAHFGEPDPEKLVVRLCEDLLGQQPTDRGASPLAVLGSCQGIRSVSRQHIAPDAGCSGLLVPDDGGFVVILRSGESERRQNFSFAHEIVHTFFWEFRHGEKATGQEEMLCNIGAAALTMPVSRFRPLLDAMPLSLDGIRACADEFAVSTTAAGRRAMDLTCSSACLFVCERLLHGQPDAFHLGPPQLSITRYWPSPSWPFGVSINCAVSSDSVIAEAYLHQDHRTIRTSLGVASLPGIYDIDAQGGCIYPPQTGHHVLALAVGPIPGS